MYSNITKKLFKNNIYNRSEYSEEQLICKDAFLKHQYLLIAILNSKEGRDLFKIRHKLPIVRVDPNGWHTLMGFNKDKAIICFRAFTGYVVANELMAILSKVEIATTENYINSNNILDAAKFYAGYKRDNKFPEIFLVQHLTLSGDGSTAQTGEGSWGSAHDAGSGDSAYTNSAGQTASIITQPPADGGYRIDRVHLPVDTAPIPDTASLIDATAKLFVNNANNGSGTGAYCLCIQGQASISTLVDADFGTFQSVDQATRKTFASISAPTQISMLLNTTGLGNINKLGPSKFGLREHYDMDNNPIPNTGGFTTDSGMGMSENTDPDKRPYFDITYPLGGFFADFV